jgi:serine/threonine protein kinase
LSAVTGSPSSEADFAGTAFLVGDMDRDVPYDRGRVSADPLLGTEIGSYRLSHVLGEGGMGRVYAADNPQIAARAAIKVLTTQDPDLVARFLAEARAVNVIAHSSIVRVFDLGQLRDGRPYIVMELVEGETLKALIRRDSPLPIGGVLHALGQALGALGAAHGLGIVHRDFKPDNIMVTTAGAVKVLDFGVAKLSPWIGGAVAPRTQTGARVGTPAYMAPEQIRGTAVDARTDIYAAGIVLFEALCGARPFKADHEFELMKGHLEDAPPRPSSLRAEIPPELDALVLQALAKNPADRFQGVGAMVAAFAHVQRSLPPAQQRLLAPRPGITLQLSSPASSSARPFATGGARPLAQDVPTVASRPSSTSVKTAASGQPAVARSVAWHAGTRIWLVGFAIAAVAGVTVGVAVSMQRNATTHKGQTSAGSAQHSAPGVGPSVAPQIETTPSGGKQLTLPIDFDPATFDHLAYLPNALAHARRVVPDVELFSITSDAVASNGRASLAPPASNVFLFLSKSTRKVDPALSKLCVVAVSVSLQHVQVTANPTTACDLPTSKVPTCTFEKIWKRALAKKGSRASPAAFALISWNTSQWVFSINAVGHPAVSMTLDDRCPQ